MDISVLLPILIVSCVACVDEQFSDKCVGVADGDTITVLRENQKIRVRLDGIDCPERGSPFSSRAKQFTSELVLGKTVSVTPKELDDYGRTVARVRVDGKDVSLELAKAGLAWHYKRHSSDRELAEAEETARAAGIGLWSLPDPQPPWEVRARQRSKTGQPESAVTEYYGNVNSHVFHAPWCPNYNCKNCTRVFKSRAEAIQAGYRPAGCCQP